MFVFCYQITMGCISAVYMQIHTYILICIYCTCVHVYIFTCNCIYECIYEGFEKPYVGLYVYMIYINFIYTYMHIWLWICACYLKKHLMYIMKYLHSGKIIRIFDYFIGFS